MHLCPQVGDETIRIEWKIQRLVVIVTLLSEVGGKVFVRWKGMHLSIGEALHQVECQHHRLVAVVVGAELQRSQQRRHHAAVMSFVRVTDDGAQGDAVGWTGGFPFLNQITQRLFTNHWKYHLANYAVRLGQCSFGQLEQEILLAGDALEVIKQLALDLAFGACANLVDGLYQQINQVVG